LLQYQSGDSTSEISRDTADALVEELSTKPRYDSSSRSKIKIIMRYKLCGNT